MIEYSEHTLDYAEMMHRARILSARAPVLECLRYGRAAMDLALDGSVEAAEILAHAYAHPVVSLQRPALGEALLALASRPALERAWTCWMELRSDALAEVLQHRPLRLPCPVRLFVLSRLKSDLVEELRRETSTDVLTEIIAATADWDPRVARHAADLTIHMARRPVGAECLATALAAPSTPRAARDAAQRALDHPLAQDSIDAICVTWAHTRDTRLASLVRRRQWFPSAPPSVATLTCLKFHPETLADPPPALVLYACGDQDPEISRHALDFLASPRSEEWRAAVCDAVVDVDCPPVARPVLASARSAPRDTARRAVFLLLTDQVDAALSLDFDQEMLSEAYRGGSPPLRRRIAAAIRRARRPDLTRILVRRRGDNHEHLMLTDAEWEMLLGTLDAPGRRDELWSLALDAPARWSVAALDRLRAARWNPPDEDGDAWRRLESARARLRGSVDWTFLELRVEPARHDLRVATSRRGGDPLPVALGAMLAVADEGSVRLFDPASSARRASLPALQEDRPSELEGALRGARILAASGDGRRLVLGDGEQIQVWELESRALLASTRAAPFDTVAASHDGMIIVTQDSCGTREYRDLAHRRTRSMETARGFDRVALSPDGSRMAITRSSEWRLYEVDPRRAMGVFTQVHQETMQPGADQPLFSPDGRALAIVTRQGLDVCDTANGRRRLHFPGRAWNPAFAADSGWLAVEQVVPKQGRRIVVLDLAHGVPTCILPIPGDLARGVPTERAATRALAFTVDGRHLSALAGSRSLLRWRLCATPLAALPLQVLMHAESVPEKDPHAAAWAYVAAVMGHRARYDIELDDEPAFVAGVTDVEIDFD